MAPRREQPIRKLQHRAGYTLVEMMVTIAIIAFLVAILLPALATARNAAKAIQCASNLRQTGIALTAFALDFDDTPPMYREPSGSAMAQLWYYKLMANDYVSNTRTPSTDRRAPGFFCPTSEQTVLPTGGHTPESFAILHGGISYGIHIGLTRNYHVTGTPYDPMRLTEIKSPSRMIFVGDSHNNQTPGWFGRYYLDVVWNAAGAAPSIRHDGAANILWADGHGTTVAATHRFQPQTFYDVTSLTAQWTTPSYWARY